MGEGPRFKGYDSDTNVVRGRANHCCLALAVYQPRVQSKADLLLSRIESNKANPIDMTMNGMFYSFDVMGDVGRSTQCNAMPRWAVRVFLTWLYHRSLEGFPYA